MYFAVEDGRLLLKRLIAPSGCSSPATSSRWCRSFDSYLADQEALAAVFDIEGEDLSTRRQLFREKRDR